MKKTNCLLSAILVLSFCHLFAGDIKVSEKQNPQIKIIENSYSSLHLLNTISSVGFSKILTSNGTFVKLNIKGFGKSNTQGEPELPVLKKLVEIPFGSEVNIQILNTSFNDFSLSEYGITEPVIPAQPPAPKTMDDTEFIINEGIYLENRFLGEEIVKSELLGVMRGVRIARLEIAPVQYNPVENLVRVYDEIELLISFTNGNIPLTLQNKKTLFSPYFNNIYTKLFNYKPLDSDELITDAPVTYVVVADPMFESDLQEFINWKTKKGFQVIEAYTNDPNVGNTTASIKEYLKTTFYNPPEGYLPQSFVLLVGDIDQLPAFAGTTANYPTDLHYSEYTNDFLPECYYGRFSATNNIELQAQISKTLVYEKYQFLEPQYLDTALLIAGHDTQFDSVWANGQLFYASTQYLNEEHGIFPFVFPQPEPPDTNYADLIKQHFNNGISFLNYTGHCSTFGFADPVFFLAEFNNLTNANKYPIMIGNCCSSANFSTTCFGEMAVRAPEKGALSYIGATADTYWDEDYYWAIGYKTIVSNPDYDPDHLGFYDRLFHDHGEPSQEWFVTQGQFPAAGNLAVAESGSIMENVYWEIYHLLGDPSVTIYMSEPDLPFVNYVSSIPPEVGTLTVNTEPYLYVALSKNGILHGAALSDENGLAEMEIFESITEPGVADIVIAGQNTQPFFGTIQVEYSEGAYVVLESFEIDDSSGNNNGQADAGEQIFLNLSLVNVGNIVASNLSATLTSLDTNITIINDNTSWPDIEPGTSLEQSGVFSFMVHEDAINGHYTLFSLDVTDGSSTWNSAFSITLHSFITSVLDATKSDPVKQINIFPNPFKNKFIVEYYLASESSVNISLLNNLGQEVAQIENSSNQISGKQQVEFVTSEMQPGFYFCKISTDDFTTVRKVILKR